MQLVAQETLERRASHVDGRPRAVGTRAGQHLAVVVAKAEGAGGVPLGEERLGQAQLGEDADAVGGDLEAPAHLVGAGVRLEHLRLDAGALEKESEGGTGDATAHHEGSDLVHERDHGLRASFQPLMVPDSIHHRR